MLGRARVGGAEGDRWHRSPAPSGLSRTARPIRWRAIRWAPAKSLWLWSMTAVALVAGPITVTWSAFALFIATSGITVCLGHSLGMHRRLIHRSSIVRCGWSGCSSILARWLAWPVPIGMIRQHDIRDWAQRKPDCHPYWRIDLASARRPLAAALRAEARASADIPSRAAGRDDPFYASSSAPGWRTSFRWALLFFALGGMPWVVWGICGASPRP